MQVKSSKNNSTFPNLKYFLPDDEYDSNDFNFLEYDLVKKLDEINMKQNEEIITEFEGSIRSNIAAKELFSEIAKANLRIKSLGKTRYADLKNYLCTHAI
ncbi:3802_t:CDS:2 [Funneliformis caledonium]|uniref:3802_t:CDS:1 n=1 Tax=Funneliformis caledonium TaxID=1117310 RepID=A0A9N9GW14_9GLOM|nr:3802_t:CDS:2 [Funneliformis caledonium]